jgi:hypothetical protein
MAIRQPYMIKSNWPTATSTLTLTAKPAESIRIKDLRFGALASGGFAECLIDRLSVGFWYIGDINANHLEQWSLATDHGNVFKRLVDLGIHNGYPLSEGQTFTVQPRVAGTEVIGHIVYEIGDADQFKQEDQNGTKSKQFVFLNYGTNSDAIDAGSYGNLDTSRNPAEYPAFPFGDTVPAKHRIEILGILLMHWKDAQGNLNPNYSHLRLIKDRVTLFDEDRAGIPVREGMGFGSWGPCRQVKSDIELFPEPLVFEPGDELIVQMEAGDKDIPESGIYLAAIERVTLIE